MDLLRNLLKIEESSPDVPGFSYDQLSDKELIDACHEMGFEEMCIIDGEGGLVNRDEIIDELMHGDMDYHSDEVPGEPVTEPLPMECVVVDASGKKVKDFETMAQAKEYVGKHKDKKLTIKEAKVINEKAVSKSQQRFMGMVHAYQKGDLEGASPEVKKAAASLSKKEAKKFAKTKHKGLPEEVKETKQYTKYTNLRKKFDYYKPVKMKQLKEMASNEHSVYPNAKVVYSKSGKPVGEVYLTDRTNAPGRWGCLHYGLDYGNDNYQTEQAAYEGLREMHAEWLSRRRHTRGNQMAEGVKTVSFKDPYKKLAQPTHGGKQGDVNNKSVKKAIEDEIGNAGMKGMKKKDRPYMEKPRFRDWLTGNMYFNMTKSGELAGNMKLSETEEHDYEVTGYYEARQDGKNYRRTFKATSPEAAKAKALANLQGMAARKENRIAMKSIKVNDAKRIEPKQDWWK